MDVHSIYVFVSHFTQVLYVFFFKHFLHGNFDPLGYLNVASRYYLWSENSVLSAKMLAKSVYAFADKNLHKVFGMQFTDKTIHSDNNL